MSRSSRAFRRFSGGLLGLVITSAWLACTDPPPPALSSSDRRLIDSLYRDTAAIKRVELDSLCVLHQPALVRQLTDSLLDARLEERARQLERLQNRPQ